MKEAFKSNEKARTFFTKNITAEQKKTLDYKFKKDEEGWALMVIDQIG